MLSEDVSGFSVWHGTLLAVPKFSRKLRRVSSFNKSINRHHHMKDHVEIGHLTKYDTSRVNRDQVMDLEIWLIIIHQIFSLARDWSKRVT